MSERLETLIEQSRQIVRDGIRHFAEADQKWVTAKASLFSGGNDSTVLTHIFRNEVDVAVHINTGIGINQTREFVRATCAAWGLKLLEESPPKGSTYRELVVDQGFPGPGHHYKMYQRLKERALRKIQRRLRCGPDSRVVFLAGRRRGESKRRLNVPEFERVGSVIWISPLVHWTSLDLAYYREAHPDIPRNEVSDLIHMSGECLCGSFAMPGERKEIGYWFPEVEAELCELEAAVRAAGHAEPRCRWGWGAGTDEERSASGPMCSSCEATA